MLAIINCTVLRPQKWLRQGLVLVQGHSIRAVGRSDRVALAPDTRLVEAGGGVIAGPGAESLLVNYIGRTPAPPAGTAPHLADDSPLVLWPGSRATLVCYHFGQRRWAMQEGRFLPRSAPISHTPDSYRAFVLRVARFLWRQPWHRCLHYLGDDRHARQQGVTFLWQYQDEEGQLHQTSFRLEAAGHNTPERFYWSPLMRRSQADWCLLQLPEPAQMLLIPLRSTRRWIQQRFPAAAATSPLPIDLSQAQAAVGRLHIVSLEDG